MNRFLFIILLITIFICNSCTKNSGPANGNSIQPNNKLDTLVFMSATVNTGNFQTDSAFGYLRNTLVKDSTNTKNILINATQNKTSSLSTISLTISNYTGPNTYTINPPNVSASYYLGSNRHYATAGQIVITSDTSNALIGNFNFIADSIAITNGKFNVLMIF